MSGGVVLGGAPDPTTKLDAAAFATVMVRTTTLGTAVTSVTRTRKPLMAGLVGWGPVKFTSARRAPGPAVARPIVGAPGRPIRTVVSVNFSCSTLRTTSAPLVPALSVTSVKGSSPGAGAGVLMV